MDDRKMRIAVCSYSNGDSVNSIANRVRESADDVRAVLRARGFVLVGRDAGEPQPNNNYAFNQSTTLHHTMPAVEINGWMRLWCRSPAIQE